MNAYKRHRQWLEHEGIRKALDLVQVDPPLRKPAMIDEILRHVKGRRQRSGRCKGQLYPQSRRTCRDWIRQAEILRNSSDLDRTDPEEGRWERLQKWERAAEIWHQRGNDLMSEDDANSSHRREARQCEELRLKFEELIVKCIHWDKIPPDRHLSSEEVRVNVIEVLSKHVELFQPQEAERIVGLFVGRANAKKTSAYDSAMLDEVLPQ